MRHYLSMITDWLAVGVAAAATIVAIVAARFSASAASAAKEQTAIQRRIMEDAASPRVWVDLVPDAIGGQTIDLVVGNSGSGLARNVRVQASRPLPHGGGTYERHLSEGISRLKQGVSSLAPGRELVWPLGHSKDIVGSPLENGRIEFTVTADGPFRPMEPETIVVDLNDWRTIRAKRAGTLHEVARRVGETRDAVLKLERTLRPALEVEAEEL